MVSGFDCGDARVVVCVCIWLPEPHSFYAVRRAVVCI